MTRTRDDALVPLGKLIDARRAELRMTLAETARACGISIDTLRTARYGNNTPNAQTCAGLERGLQWKPGSVGPFLAGGTCPEPLPGGASGAGDPEAAPPGPAPRLLRLGEEGSADDIAADLEAVRRLYPGNDVYDVAVSIMDQRKPYPARKKDLRDWLALQSAAEA
jgi:transcriptional regulator with XRE-family HTH domain